MIHYHGLPITPNSAAAAAISRGHAADVFSRLPFASADSTNIAQNVGIDSRWRGTYAPTSKDCRAIVMRDRIEAHQAVTFFDAVPEQMGLTGFSG